MLFSIITFVALANVALAGSTSHMVIGAEMQHWQCEHIPSQEWTNHYCIKGQPHVDPSGYQTYEELLAEAQEMAAAAAYEAITELHEADSASDAVLSEALAIFALPDELRVSIDDLHLFTAVGSHVAADDAADNDVASASSVLGALPPVALHQTCNDPECAATPCNMACCSDADCPCRSDQGGCTACVCEKLTQVWYHDKGLITKNSGSCWKTTVEPYAVEGLTTVYRKTTVQLDVCHPTR